MDMHVIRRATLTAGLFAVMLAGAARADHPTVGFGVEIAGPITTLAPTPLPKGFWSIGLRTEYIKFDAFSDEMLESAAEDSIEGVHSVDNLSSTSIGVGYGVTPNLTLSARLPYVVRKNIREGEIEDGEAEAHPHGDSKGVGDSVFLAQYRIMHSGSGYDGALVLGVKAPTGKTDVTDHGEVLEIEFQPGSGSWDPLFGIAVGRSKGSLGVFASALYSLATDGDRETNLGDAFFFNLALTYRVTPRQAAHEHTDMHAGDHDHGHEPGADDGGIAVDITLALNGETREKVRVDGESEANSGGDLMYVSPGVRVSGGKLGAFASVGLPVVNSSNGVQTDVDYRVIAGVAVGF